MIQKRNESLDAMRGLAILGMVLSGSIAFGNVTTAGYLTANVSQTSTPHPNASTSMISSTKRLIKYWKITNNGVVYLLKNIIIYSDL